MNIAEVQSMFEGLSPAALEIVKGKDSGTLQRALTKLAAYFEDRKLSVDKMVPPAGMIFNAFRLCPMDGVKVVLMGQDPYPGKGQAMGLSFSSGGGTLPPSLRSIFGVMVGQGLLSKVPIEGDLSSWAKQGVLMLNASLTTVVGEPERHVKIWEEYTDCVVRKVCEKFPTAVFILLGVYAGGKIKLTGKDNRVLTWGHPSPRSVINMNDNPRNFKYCDVFRLTNELLGVDGVNWDSVNGAGVAEKVMARGATVDDPVCEDSNSLWAFTDGAAQYRKTSLARASWAFYITDGGDVVESAGMLNEGKPTNNKAELMAILGAVRYLERCKDDYIFDKIVIVSDSEYSIRAVEEWFEMWSRDGTTGNKKNVGLISQIVEIVARVRKETKVEFLHVKSHRKEASADGPLDLFLIRGNAYVDGLCNEAIVESFRV